MKRFITRENKFLAGLAVIGTTALSAAIWFGPVNEPINQCNDGVSTSYTVTGELYGDQNQDGQLSGTECDWK